jgi:threonyl-tRNA synthetase
MLTVSLPNGDRKTYDRPVTAGDVAAEIGARLAKAAVAAQANGKIVGLTETLPQEGEV